MNKIKTIAIFTALAFALPVLASAASFTNVEFQNGQTAIEGTGGSTVTATFRVVVGSGEVVEQIQTDVIGDSLAPVCTSVGGTLGLEQGTHNVSIQVKLPANTGTHNLEVQGSGIFGGFRADDCVGDVVGSASFSSALRVVGTSSGTIGGTPTDPQIVALAAQIASITEAIKSLQCIYAGGTWANGTCTPKPATPPATTACTEYASLSAGLYQGSDTRPGGRVGKLQSFLMYKGFDIPLLSANQAPYGFYGSQTAGAAAAFQIANGC